MEADSHVLECGERRGQSLSHALVAHVLAALVNSQETCFVTGLVTARQMGTDYPFQDPEARKWFNFYVRTMYGGRFRNA